MPKFEPARWNWRRSSKSAAFRSRRARSLRRAGRDRHPRPRRRASEAIERARSRAAGRLGSRAQVRPTALRQAHGRSKMTSPGVSSAWAGVEISGENRLGATPSGASRPQRSAECARACRRPFSGVRCRMRQFDDVPTRAHPGTPSGQELKIVPRDGMAQAIARAQDDRTPALPDDRFHARVTDAGSGSQRPYAATAPSPKAGAAVGPFAPTA